jgi:hypothetical protein
MGSTEVSRETPSGDGGRNGFYNPSSGPTKAYAAVGSWAAGIFHRRTAKVHTQPMRVDLDNCAHSVCPPCIMMGEGAMGQPTLHKAY